MTSPLRSLAAFVVLSLAACQHGKPAAPPPTDDCKIVHDDPAHAMGLLSQRYPHDAVKVAEVIEGCVAPAGADECERVAALVKAIPQMTPGLAPKPGTLTDPVALCRGMPPEMRRCMLASYSLAHDVECAKVRQDLASTALAQLDIQPKGSASGPGACDDTEIAVLVTKDGLWIGTGQGIRGRCFSPAKDGILDFEWLERQLRHYDGMDCKPLVELAADKDVSYQDVIHAMDTAVKVGLVDVGLTDAKSLPVMLGGVADGTPADCNNGSVHVAAGAKPPSPSVPPVATSGTDNLKHAPVVIITRDEIEVAGKTIVKLSELGTGAANITELAAALPKAPADAMAILQADRDTPMNVMNRVVQTLKAAGYSNLLFAVKNK